MNQMMYRVLGLSLCLAMFAQAQPLVDRVPADAMVYVGWRGTNDLGAGFAGSHAEAIAKESRFSALIDQTLPALVKFAGTKSAQAGPIAEASRVILTSALRYPTAIFIVPGDAQTKGVPRFAMVCRPDKDADKLLQQFNFFVNSIGQEVPVKAFAVGDVVSLAINYAPDQMALAGGADARPSAIAGEAAFKSAIAQVDADPVLFAYVNPKQITAAIKSQLSPRELGSAEFKKTEQLLSELGLDRVGAIAFSGTFKNKMWQERMFVEGASRKGLASLLESKPFSTELLSRIPASSTSVSTFRFDPVKLVAEARRAATAVDPKWGEMVDMGTGAVTMAVGANLENDILAPLGDEWVVYNSPEVGGNDFYGSVVINKLDKPMDAKTALASLSIFLSNTGRTFTRNESFKIAGSSIKVDDMTIYYLATPLVAPAWTIKDGYLYIGFYPQSVVAAARYAGEGIQKRSEFAEAMGRLEQTDIVGMQFVDVKSKLPDGYSTVRLITRSLLGASDMFAVPAPEMILPTLPTMLRETSAAAGVTWTDDAGLHGKWIEAYPGSSTIAGASVMDALTNNSAMAISVLLPSLNRAREAANRIKSASNMRQILLGSIMFANDNRGAFPNELGQLVEGKYLTGPDVFVNPRTGNEPPRQLAGNPQLTADWINSESDYVYLGKGRNAAKTNADAILIYEYPSNLDEGINVGFADGSVTFIRYEVLEETFKASGLKAPDIGRSN
jgi:hypothetical protein